MNNNDSEEDYDSYGQPPLHLAATYGEPGDVQEAQRLLDKGADPNQQDGNGDTPLHCAAERGNIEIVKRLLAAGADLNLKNSAGQTPLQLVNRNIRAGLKDKPYKEIAELLNPPSITFGLNRLNLNNRQPHQTREAKPRQLPRKPNERK